MSNLLNIKDQNGNWIPIPIATNGIASIVQNSDYTLTIILEDGTVYTTTSIRGEQGVQGVKGDKGDAFTYADFTPEQLASLKGEKGDKGDQGIQGIQGERGIQGEQGVQGEQGIQGLKGDTGEKGDKGDAFTYADFTPEQLVSLKGEKGDKGDAFEYSDFTPQQLTSLKGEKGDKGDAFEYSDFTPEQLASLKGEKGDTGNTGAKGDTGDSGVYVGTSAPSDTNVNVWIDSDGEPDFSLGVPPTAQTVAEMDETESSIWIYIGSEPGYIAGNWYYYNGTTWASGGVYGAGTVDVIPTQGSANAVSSGGVHDAIAGIADDVLGLKQGIITGVVSIGAGTEEIVPSTNDFQVARITPKNGIISENSGAYMNIGGVGNTYYPLITTNFLSDDIKAIQSSYSDVKFVLFVYDKTSSEYLGAIYQEYTFKSMEDLASSNTLYPYSEVNMDTMRTMFPDYKYRLEITDASANQSTRPVTTDIVQWCTYTVPRTTAQRQLIKTVNSITPDNSGNIEIVIPNVDVYERISLDSSELREGFYRYDTGIGNRSYQAVIIPKGDQNRHTYYGIVFKDILADNIYKIEASDTIYALIASWDRTDGSFVGYYTGSGFEIPEREINANNVDTQNVNLKALRAQYPNYFFKVSFVDVSTYDRPSMNDVLDSVVFVYESASKYELEKVSDTNIPELPAYWVDFLNEKIEGIRENMTSVGRNGETFIFITDLHWPNNVKNSPRLMFEILRRLNIHHCICGGDVINEGTREESIGVMVDAINAFKHYDIDFLTALGNHDRNWNTYNDQHSYPERRFTEADIFALLERMSKKVYQNFADDKFDNGIGFNMYYDDPITNTRFIIIDINDVITDPDTGTNTFEFTNYNELAQVLHDSNGKHIVIISHMLEAGNNIGTRLATISDALNTRTTINTDYCTADFTGCTGKVYLILGGHAHGDNSRLSSGGIPIVTCDTDSNLSHNADAHIDGTTKEQAFDVITINYTDNSIKFVRIGRGSDRTFTVGN